MKLSETSSNLIFVISSLTAGGAEKVMAELANQASRSVQVTLVILSKKERFYQISPKVKVIEPNFTLDQMSRILFKWRNFWWLRGVLKSLKAKPVLSFSGKYNAFVLLASLGLGKQVFVSDRSRPGISYGRFLDILNPLAYRLAAGIVAQTQAAKRFAFTQTKHKNIKVIPNPIAVPADIEPIEREKIVLNVGRFIASKHQDWLANYFEKIDQENWQLVFLGDGNNLGKVQSIASSTKSADSIKFLGNTKNVSSWYSKAAIFAFTSSSEGFPNGLAEAMAQGCACISYDCLAGPSDIIDDGINGFLIPEGNHQWYQEKLSLLIQDEELRIRFGQAAIEKMKEFDAEKITQQFLDFMLEGGETKE